MRRLMVAAPASGSGKTVLTCGLLAAFQARGISTEAFKCGPDYIDPMFHQKVLGLPSRNLDLFLQGEQGVRHTLSGQQADLALIEGAMGYYDGLNGTDQASAWHTARTGDLPVVLAVRPGGSSLTLAAQLKGLRDFRRESNLRGIVLTLCKPSLYAHLAPILTRETGLPVLGYLPPMEEGAIKSRHLGLLTAGEITDLEQRFAKIAQQLEKTVDLDALWSLAAEVPPQPVPIKSQTTPRCTIGVAWDEAFCFYYQDSLDALKAAGAELNFFSPLRHETLPAVDGLYLGGGYPELYAAQLTQQTSMRQAISAALADGLPTVAECGGFLYLQEQLQTPEGIPFPTVGFLPGESYPTGRLQRFGYLTIKTETDSLLFRAGEEIPAHEFHHWDSTHNGTDLVAQKVDGRTWSFGYTSPTLYAAFPHLHLGGQSPLAARFVAATAAYRERRNAP